MHKSIVFTRFLFALFITLYMVSLPTAIEVKLVSGLAIAAVLMALDFVFRKMPLQALNTIIVGLFVGYLTGQALCFAFDAVVRGAFEGARAGVFLAGLYLGCVMTLRAADKFYLSIPFVRFSKSNPKTRRFLLDPSVLGDARIIDFCASHILDDQLILPKFVLKSVYDDETRLRVLKKLKEMPQLDLLVDETDFPEMEDGFDKLLRLARHLDSDILTADSSQLDAKAVEGVLLINLHTLSKALKPLMQAGEQMEIKIQRLGKEPQQGVGYLDDGTMVVVNGGADFIGEMVEVQVLSVKHTSSGRMIFCNALEEYEEVHV